MKIIFIFILLVTLSNALFIKAVGKTGKYIFKKTQKNILTKQSNNFNLSEGKKYFLKIPAKRFVEDIHYYYDKVYKNSIENLNNTGKKLFIVTSKNLVKEAKFLLGETHKKLKNIIKNDRSFNYRKKAIEITTSKKGGWVKDPYSDVYCRLKNMEADHIFPLSWGGSNENWNLVMACKKSNRSKSDKIDYRIIKGYIYKLKQYFNIID